MLGCAKKDITRFVRDYEASGVLANGCNSYFITLIPRIKNSLLLKDYKRVNIVGCLYEILSKVLATILKLVLDKIISSEQSTYVGGRSIFDDLLCLTKLCRV